MKSGCDLPLAFPVLAPGSIASTETSVDINAFHCVHGHANELLLRQTAKSLGLELAEKPRPCTGCSMASLSLTALSYARQRSWGRVFVDLSGPDRTPSLSGARYVMLSLIHI